MGWMKALRHCIAVGVSSRKEIAGSLARSFLLLYQSRRATDLTLAPHLRQIALFIAALPEREGTEPACLRLNDCLRNSGREGTRMKAGAALVMTFALILTVAMPHKARNKLRPLDFHASFSRLMLASAKFL